MTTGPTPLPAKAKVILAYIKRIVLHLKITQVFVDILIGPVLDGVQDREVSCIMPAFKAHFSHGKISS